MRRRSGGGRGLVAFTTSSLMERSSTLWMTQMRFGRCVPLLLSSSFSLSFIFFSFSFCLSFKIYL